MIRVSGTVRYRDGRTDTFEAGTAAMNAWERYALRHGYPTNPSDAPLLWSTVVAHKALGVEAGIETWELELDSIEIETSDVPPTLPAPSVG